MAKATVEVNPVDADKLQVENPISYEQICTIVGTLYLDSIRNNKSLELKAKSLLNQLNDELEDLRGENRELKKQLEEDSVE